VITWFSPVQTDKREDFILAFLELFEDIKIIDTNLISAEKI
jgi:hypothetical protein